jgi:hypothetical protein
MIDHERTQDIARQGYDDPLPSGKRHPNSPWKNHFTSFFEAIHLKLARNRIPHRAHEGSRRFRLYSRRPKH